MQTFPANDPAPLIQINLSTVAWTNPASMKFSLILPVKEDPTWGQIGAVPHLTVSFPQNEHTTPYGFNLGLGGTLNGPGTKVIQDPAGCVLYSMVQQATTGSNPVGRFSLTLWTFTGPRRRSTLGNIVASDMSLYMYFLNPVVDTTQYVYWVIEDPPGTFGTVQSALLSPNSTVLLPNVSPTDSTLLSNLNNTTVTSQDQIYFWKVHYMWNPILTGGVMTPQQGYLNYQTKRPDIYVHCIPVNNMQYNMGYGLQVPNFNPTPDGSLQMDGIKNPGTYDVSLTTKNRQFICNQPTTNSPCVQNLNIPTCITAVGLLQFWDNSLGPYFSFNNPWGYIGFGSGPSSLINIEDHQYDNTTDPRRFDEKDIEFNVSRDLGGGVGSVFAYLVWNLTSTFNP